MRVADQLSTLEKALRNVPVAQHYATLDILETLLKNIAQNPKEAKFRKIKLSNAKIQAAITSVLPALEVLLACGFVFESEQGTGEPFLVLPETVKITFPNHVNKIIDCREEYFRKEIEKARVAKGLGRVAPAGEAKPADPRSVEEISGSATVNLKWVVGVDAKEYAA
eukprot:g16640.t1